MDHSKDAAALFDKHAVHYQQLYMDVSQYAKSLDFFCDNLKVKQASVLELACGPGNATRYLLQRRPDMNILGTDLSENMIQLARINNPEARFVLMDARSVSRLEKFFDACVIAFLLPYLDRDETRQLLLDTASKLSVHGLLYLSLIEGANEESGIQTSSKGDQVYMYYYRLGDIIPMLKEAGLNCIHEARYQTVMANGKEVVDLVLVARKTS